MNIKTSVILLPFVILAFGFSDSSSASTRLQWKFAKGQKFNIELVQTVTQKSGEMSSKYTTTFSMLWTVADVAPDGTATIEQTIKRVIASMQLPNFDEIKYDSGLDEGIGSAKILSEAFKPIIGSPTPLRINSQGKGVADQKKVDATPAEAQKVATIVESFQLAGLPDKALETGERWVEVSVGRLGITGQKTETKTTYEFEGPEAEDVQIVRVKVTSAISAAKESDARPKIEINQQTGDGFLRFDAEHGFMKESQIQNTIDFKTDQGESDAGHSVSLTTRFKVTEVDRAVVTNEPRTTPNEVD